MVASVLKDNLWLDKIRRTGFFQFTLVNIDVRLCDITNCFYFASHQYCQLYCKMSNIPLQLCTDALIVSILLTQREIVPETVDKRSLIAPLQKPSSMQIESSALSLSFMAYVYLGYYVNLCHLRDDMSVINISQFSWPYESGYWHAHFKWINRNGKAPVQCQVAYHMFSGNLSKLKAIKKKGKHNHVALLLGLHWVNVPWINICY